MSTIEKALRLLEHLSGKQPEIGLTEFKVLTGLDKGTLHRHLTSLKNCGFLEQNHTTKAYRLGPAVIRLSAVREKTVPIFKTVQFYVDSIADEVHELVHASLPQQSGMSSIYAKDGGFHGTRVNFDEAEILPFHATASGIAMLAFGRENLLEKALSRDLKQYTFATSTKIEDVEKLIEEARSFGVISTDQAYEADVGSFAVPFYGHIGDAMGTLAIAAPVSRITDQFKKTSIVQLIAASKGLSRDLGGQIPNKLADKWSALLET